MAKRIVVCSDGTGNTAIKGRGTNVFKVFEAVDLVGHRTDPKLTPQIALYDDGVGTENFKPMKVLGGAFGWGLGRNVRHLYRELARVYDPGDEIFMFGFSRGAFTVRTLAGFIATCGLVDPNKIERRDSGGLNRAVKDAYRAYRKCYRPALWRLFAPPTRDAGNDFKSKYSVSSEVRVRFIGVWDTVDAVGLPFHLADIVNALFFQFKFPDQKLSTIVDNARQALSIDDERQTFSPQLWDETKEGVSSGQTPRVKQVWFAGVHSNVGGGYPKQGMSLVALDWMLGEAERAGDRFGVHGLRMNAAERQYFRDHANSDDKLYDPRAGLGLFYRWRIRDIAALCARRGVKPAIHASALERVSHGTDNYAPGNLPTDAVVVRSAPIDGEDVRLTARRAAGLESVLRSGGVTPLHTVRPAIAAGIASYYTYVFSVVGVVMAAWWLSPESLRTHPWTEVAKGIALELVSDGRLAFVLASGFALAYVLMLVADRRIGAVFSGYWYAKQPRLREALKQARREPAVARQVAG